MEQSRLHAQSSSTSTTNSATQPSSAPIQGSSPKQGSPTPIQGSSPKQGSPTPVQNPSPKQGAPTQSTPPQGTATPNNFGSTTGMTDVEKQVSLRLFDQINKERSAAGLSAYTLDENMTRAAYKHTVKQFDANTLSHQLPGEPPLADRLTSEGVTWHACGENVGTGGGYTDPWSNVLMVHNLMMAEPANVGHHAAIISKTYHRIGLSVVIRGNSVYLTEDFAD